jgi:hypothetical protein
MNWLKSSFIEFSLIIGTIELGLGIIS